MRLEPNSSKAYKDLLRTDQWQEKRKKILKRDEYHCLNCGSTYGLEVHHRQYHMFKQTRNFRKPWQYADNNLITLCARCHQVGHRNFNVPVFNV